MATLRPEALDTPMSPPLASRSTPYRWTGYHQYQPVQVAPEPDRRLPSPISTTHSAVARSVSPTWILDEPRSSTRYADAALTWRPAYLRRIVIASFILLFALILGAIEVLLALSDRNYGIATGYPGQHYLWTYGPTAFLTIIAAVWSRVDYQSKLVTPWINLSRQFTHPNRTLLQDYVSDFVLISVFKALRCRDYVVAITSAISVLIKILIVVSTGLITLSWTTVRNESYSMLLQDRFVDDDSRLNFTTGLPFYMMKGFVENNLTYPDGLYNGYAFQSLRPDLPASAKTSVVTDGFRSSLECQPVNINLTWAQPRNPHYPNSTYMNFTATSESCNVQLGRSLSPPWHCQSEDECTTEFSRFTQVQCDEAADDDDGKRMLLVFGNLTFTIDYSQNMSDYTFTEIIHPYLWELKKSTQMLCIPRYSLGRLGVTRNGTETMSVTPIGSWNTTLSSVSPWSIMYTHDLATGLAWSVGGSTNSYSGASIVIGDALLDTDESLRLAFLSSNPADIAVSSLYDASRLHNIVEEYYQEFTAIIAKQSLMQQTPVSVTGISEVDKNRLIVRSWAAQWMAGLLAACILLSAFALFLVPRRGILPYSPSTLAGIAVLIQHSRDLLARLRDAGTTDKRGLNSLLSTAAFTSGIERGSGPSQAHFAIIDTNKKSGSATQSIPSIRSPHTHPAILHPGTRIGLSFLLVSLIVALELLLRKSISEEGLGDVGDDTYLHYTWTTIPAIVFGILAIIFSSMDFAIRALAPYAALKRTVDAHKLINLEFLDMSLPRTMIREVKNASFGPLSSTLAFLVASLFTTLSASLFHPTFIEATGSVNLRINESFSPNMNYITGDEGALQIASLVLASNLSYPKFTYEDLAFPGLITTDMAIPDGFSFNTSSIPIHAVVPALRPKLECRSYGASDIQLNLTMNDTMPSDDYPNTIGVLINGEVECIDRDSKYENYRYNGWFEMTTLDPTLFGQSTQAQNLPDLQGCSDHLYIWGKADGNSDPIVQHIAAMACNTTWEALDVNATFVGTGLDLDPEHPPIPLEDTARLSTANTVDDFTNPTDYSALPGFRTAPDLVFDNFFRMLTMSRWAIPQSNLADGLADDNTKEAIKLQSRILQTQMLAWRRVPANETNSTIADPKPGETDDKLVFKATMTEVQARHRVVQDPISTRILQALLGATLVILLLGWFFMHDTAILATSPTTIASVTALIAGGNLVDLLPDDAGWRSREEIEAALGRGTRFWMGLSTLPKEELETSGTENEGTRARFGIFALREGDQKTEYHGGGGIAENGSRGLLT